MARGLWTEQKIICMLGEQIYYFNTQAKLDYLGKIPDKPYNGVDEMSEKKGTSSSLCTMARRSGASIRGESWNRIVS